VEKGGSSAEQPNNPLLLALRNSIFMNKLNYKVNKIRQEYHYNLTLPRSSSPCREEHSQIRYLNIAVSKSRATINHSHESGHHHRSPSKPCSGSLLP